VFTARYGLMPYIKQITFRLLKVNVTADGKYSFSPCLTCTGFLVSLLHLPGPSDML
jgi:hypothetical protein